MYLALEADVLFDAGNKRRKQQRNQQDLETLSAKAMWFRCGPCAQELQELRSSLVPVQRFFRFGETSVLRASFNNVKTRVNAK